MDLYFMQRFFSRFYGWLGYIIARHPYMFIAIPILLSATSSVGIIFASQGNSSLYLFTSENFQSMKNKRNIDRLFPMNTSYNFDASRLTSIGKWASVIITSNDGKTILREHIFKEIVHLDEIFRNITVLGKDRKYYTYSQLCAIKYGKCDENEILRISWKIKQIELKKLYIKYPIDYSNHTYNYTNYVKNLGGVSTNENGEIIETKAVRLFYHLKSNPEFTSSLTTLWLDEFVNKLEKTYLNNITVSPLTTSMLDHSVMMHMKITLPYAIISSFAILVFCIIALMSIDWVRSKPWLAISGLIGVGISIISTIGIVIICGVPFNSLVLMVGFLVLAIGMDDVFVLIAAWRKTNPSQDVIQRMSTSYSEAAVSLTITSLSNMICLGLGATAPYPAIKTFCIFATVGIFLTYFYQLTFFGGCMALSGYREEKQLHPFTFHPVLECSEERGKAYNFFCSRTQNTGIKTQYIGLNLMRRFGILISLPTAKCIIFVMYIIYLIVSGVNIVELSIGLDDNITFPQDTPPIIYFKKNLDYFKKYSDRLQIVIPCQMDYSNVTVQTYIETMLKSVESNAYITKSAFTESWLRFYLTFVKSKLSKTSLSAYNISNKLDFIDALNLVFLKYPQTKHLRQDIVFNKNYTEIVASRFIVQTTNLIDSESFIHLYKSLNMTLESYNPIFFYTPKLLFYESLLTAKTNVVFMVSIAAITMFVVLIIFIPDVRISFCGFFQIVSIQIGTIGFMVCWDVKLNIITIIFLTMCVGLSVDYTAHLCYVFSISKKETVDARLCEAFNFVGVPIIEGALTTILAVFALIFSRDYAFEIFCKIILLVSVFSLLHALCFLSLFLNFCDAGCRKMQYTKELWTPINFESVSAENNEDSPQRVLKN